MKNSDCNTTRSLKSTGFFFHVHIVDISKDKVRNMEEWKDIKGYEGLYQVSNLGRVRSLDRQVRNRSGIAIKKGKILSLVTVNKHYKKVSLWKDNIGENRLVHRLVAEAFIPNPNNFPEVNHKDENPKNNTVNNLEWCDRLYNANYGTAIARATEKRKGVSVGEQPIEQYTIDGKFIRRYDSALKAAESINGDNSAICKCANGKSKTSYGYVWRWENEQGKKAI